ncbi:NAD(+) diphosphatase [Massilia arenosa]|uniref:NAD(+) diphosphatase n=1 Tax=Zemynaea arenosa TaxID=2561931 RepID=A0A4Y9SC45_9BURK|nr:NAD(+) diphosphatase [Massilia arenosa]TFW18193.1 NAD(+) diphosphatase [Massilia arenosa]
MLRTPDAFSPLLSPLDHPDPLTLVFQEGRLLVRAEDLALAPADVLAGLVLPAERIHPVGLLGERYVQAVWLDADVAAPEGHEFKSLRALFGNVDDEVLGLASRGVQIAEWARTHRYCGACAHPMALVFGERCMRCPHCGHSAYPRISPAMIVIVRKEDKVLLALHAQSPYKRYAPLAGFLEAGESAEEAVHREVYEEVGLRVHNLRYIGSQSWPFPHSLMIAFTADYLSGEIRVDPDEIAEARWFGPDDEWPDTSPGASISHTLVNMHRPAAAR